VCIGNIYSNVCQQIHTRDIVSLSSHLVTAASYSHALAVCQAIRVIAAECADGIGACIAINNAACCYAAVGLDVSALLKHAFFSFKALIGSGGVWSDVVCKWFHAGTGECVVDDEIGRAFLVVALNYGSVFKDVGTLDAVFGVCVEMGQDTDVVVQALTRLGSESIHIKDFGKRLSTLANVLYDKQLYHQALTRFALACNWYRDKRDYEAFIECVGCIGSCLVGLAGVYSVVSCFDSVDSIDSLDSLDSVGRMLVELWQAHCDDFTRGIVAWDDGIRDQLASFSYTARRAGLFLF